MHRIGPVRIAATLVEEAATTTTSSRGLEK